MKNGNGTNGITTTNGIFNSPTDGPLSFEQVIGKIITFQTQYSELPYRVIIGTDSQEVRGEGTNFVTAVILHRVGNGAIYFWRKTNGVVTRSFKQRILTEAIHSLEFAENLTEKLAESKSLEDNLEIHVDIGRVGPTREMISEVIGMIRSSGFEVKIKPDAFGATKVADRHV